MEIIYMENNKNVGFLVRFLAFLIDTLMIYVILVFVGYEDYYYYIEISDMFTQTQQLKNMDLINNILNLLNMIVVIFFWVYFNGQTPGKKLMGIKIVSLNNDPITLKQAVIRYIGYFISAFMLGIGFLMIAIREDKRGLHDLIANTKVVFNTK